MKKLTFLFAMVFAVSMAMAQTAVVNQTSDNGLSTQTADVNQTGNSSVKIDQVTSKDDWTPPPPEAEFNHIATAKQSGGNDNKIIINQSAEGWINGGNLTNSAKSVQDGKKNESKQTQIANSFTSGGMDFDILQKGEENDAVQYGTKTETEFDIVQDGKRNDALQKTTGEKTGVLVGDIKQVGNDNEATQLFHGQDVRNAGAYIEQKGNDNEAKQEFDLLVGPFWGPAANSSKADIIQKDNNHYAYQSQIGQGSYQYIKQSGNNNDARMWSEGNYNMAYSVQKGTNGTVKIVQKQDEFGPAAEGALIDGNLVMISQDGNGSKANIMQDGFDNVVEGLGGAGTYAVNDNGADLKVSQIGENNLVQSRQVVAASETVTQMGWNNTAIVNQF